METRKTPQIEMTQDDIKTAVLGALWSFEKSGYTNEELAEEVNRLLPWDAENLRCRTAERNTELLADHIRDKQEIAKSLGTDPIHDHMKREVGDIIQENRQLKEQLAYISKTQADNMLRLSDMIDERQSALGHIAAIMREKDEHGEDLLIGSTAWKSVIRWAVYFQRNAEPSHRC